MYESRIVSLFKKGFSIDYIIDDIYYKEKAKNYSFYNFGNRKVMICTNNITETKIRGEVYKILYNYIQNEKDRSI